MTYNSYEEHHIALQKPFTPKMQTINIAALDLASLKIKVSNYTP